MKVGRNDPCWCGSGLKYKYCHFEIDTASSENHLQVARKIYCRNWKKNAAYYASQGCYEWMASRLKIFSPKRILDIGCGEGSGLLAILSTLGDQDITLISLEENPDCIYTTEQNLRSKGYEASIILRMQAVPKDNHKYLLGIEEDKLVESTGITLIESDILLKDNDLYTFLMNIPRFDAITVWLIGTHTERRNCENIVPLQIKTSGEYRLRVQNQIYQNAERLLRSGGVLQIVDRGEVPNTVLLRDDFLNAHREQASVTSLDVKSFDYLVYNEPSESRKVTMQLTIGKSGRTPNLSRFAMICIESVKP